MHSRSARRLPWAVAGLLILAVSTGLARSTPDPAGRTLVSAVAGTWTGTSTCVGNRPACKNEVVVYRLLPVDGHPRQVRWLGDKIIDGKRVPMGALVFDVDEQKGTLRGEFHIGQTHGVWSFTVSGDSMKGTLVVLPGGAVGRDVSVHRAKDADVPAPPPMSDYNE